MELNKTRLENEIDSLPFHEYKLYDMPLCLDGLYDIIVELEEKNQRKLHRKVVEQDAIIYTLLTNFDKVYKSAMKRKNP